MKPINIQTDLTCLALYLIAAQFIPSPQGTSGAIALASAHIVSLIFKGEGAGNTICSVLAFLGFCLMAWGALA